MEIEVLGTGSSGNCYKLDNGSSTLLLECGLPFKVIQRKLGFKTSEIDACLISHEHQDHAKAAKDLAKAGIDLYMTKGTAEALNLYGHRINTFEGIKTGYILTYKAFNIGCYRITPFMTIHDVREPVGYVISDLLQGEQIFFVTDTAYLPYKIPKVDYIMIECNYTKSKIDSKLRYGLIHASLRNRIVKNHMSLETVVEALKLADLSKCKKIYVLHLSDGNSDEAEIKRQIQEVSGVEVEVC